MTKRMFLGLLGSALLATLPLGLLGVADALDDQGFLNPNFGDIYTLACNSPQTHCAGAVLYDLTQDGNPDTWQLVHTAYYPAALLGKGATWAIESTGFNFASTPFVYVCRPASTVGAMRTLISVSHPAGVNNGKYELLTECFDKNFNPIADSKSTLKRTTTSE